MKVIHFFTLFLISACAPTGITQPSYTPQKEYYPHQIRPVSTQQMAAHNTPVFLTLKQVVQQEILQEEYQEIQIQAWKIQTQEIQRTLHWKYQRDIGHTQRERRHIRNSCPAMNNSSSQPTIVPVFK